MYPSTFSHRNGTVEITVASGDKLAIWSRATVQVYRKYTYADGPDRTDFVQEIAADTETVLGAYSDGATIILETERNADLYYEAGAQAQVKAIRGGSVADDPNALNATGNVTSVMIIDGIVTSTTAAAVTGTLPTGANLEANNDWKVNESRDWSVINTGGSNAFTVAGDTGHTIVGAAAVAASTSGRFRTRKTAASTFITYRIA